MNECDKCTKPLNRHHKGKLCSVCENRMKEYDLNIVLIHNDVLAYAMYQLQSGCSYDDVERILHDGFSPDKVSIAKHVLWEHYKANLPKWETRNNNQGAQGKDKKAKEIEDILKNLTKIDKDGAYDKVKFVAMDFSVLPKLHANELNMVSILERLRNVEQSNEKLVASIAKQDVVVNDLNSKYDSVTRQLTQHTEQGNRNEDREIRDNRKKKSNEPPVTDRPPLSHSVGNTAAQGCTAQPGCSPQDGNKRDATTKRITKDDLVNALNSIDSDAGTSKSGVPANDEKENTWVTKVSKKEKQQTRRNDTNGQMAKAGIRPASNTTKQTENYHMFVGGLHEESTCDTIKKWLNQSGIKTVAEVTKVSPDDRPYCSFHVVMEKRDYLRIIKNKFKYWPKDVTCRRYFIPDGDDDSRQDGNQEDRAVGGTPNSGSNGVTSVTVAHIDSSEKDGSNESDQ